MWLRLDRSIPWFGLVSLAAFAWLLTLSAADQAGRAYAVFGSIHIVSSLLWLWAVGGHRPDRWDLAGASLCLVGEAVIPWGPRGAA